MSINGITGSASPDRISSDYEEIRGKKRKRSGSDSGHLSDKKQRQSYIASTAFKTLGTASESDCNYLKGRVVAGSSRSSGSNGTVTVEDDYVDEISEQLADDSEEENILELTPEAFKQRLITKNFPKDAKIIVHGDLELIGWSRLTSLPDQLTVHGDLEIVDCSGLISLSDTLSVLGSLTIAGCTNLRFLSDHLSVTEDLTIFSCNNLISLADHIDSQGNVHLNDCRNFFRLPDHFTVQGNLYLDDCTSFPSLPVHLSVQGVLRLCNCSSLTTVPSTLTVHGDFNIYHCRGLISIPEHLNIHRHLRLCHCSNLTSLPNSIVQWGSCSDGSVRIIDLTNTGLSDAVIESLRECVATGIVFYFSQRPAKPEIQFTSIEEGLQFWGNLAEVNQLQQLVFTEYADQVCSFLSRLTATEEYQNQQTRICLANRVIDVFSSMSLDTEIKGKAVDLIYHGLASCDDRIIDAFNQIELMIEVHNLEKGNFTEEDLRVLGKRFLLLEMVNEKAKEHVQSLSFVDEIEVYLAFQIALADRFNLPVKTRNMIFRGCAEITDAQIEQIGDQIEAEFSDEKLETYLLSWSPWQKFIRESKIPAYESLPFDPELKLDGEEICPISQDKPENPVFYLGQVYDYEGFIEHYKTNGTNPMKPSDKIEISLLKRYETEQNK